MKNMKLILMICTWFTAVSLAQGQGWQQTYPNATNIPLLVTQTQDSGYMFIDDYFGSYNFNLFKVDPNGVFQWDSAHGHSGYTGANDFLQTQDNGFLVAETNGRLVKFSQNGALLWEQGARMVPRGLIELPSGDIVACGDSAAYYSKVAKYDNLGNVIWEKRYPSYASFIGLTSGALDIVQTVDGGYITLAFKSGNMHLIKIDGNGTLQWTSEFSPFGSSLGPNTLYKIFNTQDGGYMVGLNFATFNNYRIFFHKFDSAGTLQWTHIIGEAEDYFEDLIATPDGGYLAVGNTYKLSQPSNYSEHLLVTKVSPDATYREWERIFIDTSSYSYAYSANNTLDGGYIIGGRRGYAIGIKLDSLGSLGVPCSDTTFLTSEICNGDTFTVGSSTYTTPGIYMDRFVTRDACDSLVVTTLTSLYGVDSLGNPLVLITGTVYENNVGSCVYDSGDDPLANWVVEAESGGNTTYATTDSSGQYSFIVPYGTYNISAQTPANWTNCGSSSQAITLDSNSDCSVQVDIGMVPDYDCALLDIDLSVICLVPCSTSTYHLNYHNIGTSTAYNPTLVFAAGPYITVDWSSIPWQIPQSGNLYQFQLDSVPAGASGWIAITVTVDCDPDLIGYSVCSGGIHNASQCCNAYQLYSGAQIELEAQCVNNDSIEFRIINTGAGNMLSDLDYFILQDDIVYAIDQFNLGSSQTEVIRLNADGRTYRLEAEQEPTHPYLAAPAIVVEGCGAAGPNMVSLGYSDILENGDQVPSIDFDGTEITEDCRCNRMYGSPLGVDVQHYITANEQLEYTIRFQNQGSDTAFNFMIIDTLPEELDPMSIIKGEASHNFRFVVEDKGIVKWELDGINLAPGTIGTMDNSGFVKFTVNLKPNLTVGTIITNTTYIYFEGQEVSTNEVFHTIGERFVDFLLPLTVGDIKDKEHVLNIFPNPFNESTTLELQGIEAKQVYIEIHDMEGRLIQRVAATSRNIIQIPRNGMPNGMYTYQVIADGEFIGTGKLIVGRK